MEVGVVKFFSVGGRFRKMVQMFSEFIVLTGDQSFSNFLTELNESRICVSMLAGF
jgi:hypothetical protein